MTRPDLSLCVINRNGERHLPRCLEAVRQRREAFSEILLVDDASTDGSVEAAIEVLPDLRVLRLSSARGPGGARNAGLRELKGRRVLFLDSDVILDAGCPESLLSAADAREADLAVPVVVWAAHPDEVHFDGAGAHFLGLMVLTNRGLDVRDLPAAPREVGSLTTCCFLLDRGRWPVEQPFDESFVFNLEDHDLGLRARIAGRRILSVPSARVLHGSGTDGFSVRSDRPPPTIRTYCLIRNRWLILLKDFEARSLLVLAPALAAFEIFQLAAVLRKGWIREWLRAIGSILRHLPEHLRARRRVQAERVRRDRDVLEGGPLPFRPQLVRGTADRWALSVMQTLTDGYWAFARRVL